MLKINDTLRFFKGFTLIELLVVLVLIGVILSFVTLSVGNNSLARKMEEESQKLSYLLQLAYQESVMKSQEMGVSFKKDSYEFYLLQGKKWQVISDDALFRPRTLPPNMQIKLLISGQSIDIDKTLDSPQLLILSSGELTPFEIVWTSELDSTLNYHIVGTLVGKITLNY